MRFYAAAIYLFLYAPIALIVLFSFNSGLSASDFQGFSAQWYGKAAGNRFVVEAVVNSLIVAASSASLATLFGTAAALAIQRVTGIFRLLFDALTYVAIMVPGIVIGIATLIALVTAFGAVNGLLSALWPGDAAAAPSLGFGYGSIIAAHTLFNMALVIVIMRARLAGMDRSLIEASADLYATPWRTFRQVTLPQILPAVIAGFLLSFTFSMDDYIVASWVAGPTVTLPIYVFNSIRRGVTPEINAIGTAVLATSLVLLFGSQLLLRRRDGRSAKAA
jgi:spermidine/putrescine transport system permease protein